MILKLQRIREINNATIGELFIDNKFICYTLEDKVRSQKIKHETAIPAGTYLIEITYSSNFKKMLPLLLNVPDFVGIRIHPGNNIDDSSGCILVGTQVVNDKLIHSITAFTKLFTLIQKALKTEAVQIDIYDINIPVVEPVLPQEIIEEPKDTVVSEPVIITPITESSTQTTQVSWKNNFWLNFFKQIWVLFKKK